MDSREDLKIAMADWLEEYLEEFLDEDDAYEQLEEMFQPILSEFNLP